MSFSLSPRPERLWGSPTPLSNEYRGQRGRGMRLTTHPQLQPRLRMRGAIPPLPHTFPRVGA